MGFTGHGWVRLRVRLDEQRGGVYDRGDYMYYSISGYGKMGKGV